MHGSQAIHRWPGPSMDGWPGSTVGPEHVPFLLHPSRLSSWTAITSMYLLSSFYLPGLPRRSLSGFCYFIFPLRHRTMKGIRSVTLLKNLPPAAASVLSALPRLPQKRILPQVSSAVIPRRLFPMRLTVSPPACRPLLRYHLVYRHPLVCRRLLVHQAPVTRLAAAGVSAFPSITTAPRPSGYHIVPALSYRRVPSPCLRRVSRATAECPPEPIAACWSAAV